MVIAAVLTDWALADEFSIERVATFEARGTHAFGWPDTFCGVFRIGNDERTVFAAEKTGSVKGFEFFAFAEIKSLADVDERRDGRISGAKRARDHRAKVRRGDSLGRGIAGVPLILMAGMKDEAQVAGGVRADQRRAIHHAGDVFKALGEFDIVDDGIDLREGAEDLVGFDAAFEGGVTFRIERFSVGHAAGHPENDDGVGRGSDFFLLGREDLTRKTGAESGERGGTGGFKKVTTIHFQ